MTHFLFTVMPMFVILFWLILFCIDEKKNKAKRFLIFFLFITLLNYTIHWFYFNHNYKIYLLLDSIWVFTSLSIYPLYYYYIRLLTIDVKIDYKWSWILIPAFMLSLFSAIIYWMMSTQELEIFNNEILYHNRAQSSNYTTLIRLQILRMELFKVVYAIGVFLTVIYGLRLLKKFNEKVFALYSNVQHRELYTIKLILIFLMITAIISMISSTIGKSCFASNTSLLAILSFTHSIALFGISYAGYKQSFTINDLTKDQFQSIDENYQVEDDKNDLYVRNYNELYKSMEYLLKSEQIFKDPDLRLNDLALKLGTNRTYASQLIHIKANSNFCDYINEHRITYAKNMLSSSEENELTIEEIAFKSGFSSQSSFYRVFMKMEGISPARYRKKLSN